MKKIFLIALCIFLCMLKGAAQTPSEVTVRSTVSEVTVFIEGAQILRKQQVVLPAGKSLVKFVNLSPYVDAKSVQPKIVGKAMITSVNYLTKTLRKATENPSKSEYIELTKKYDMVSNQLLSERSKREVVQAELDYLEVNKKVGGVNNGVSLVTLRETANYYRERLTQLKSQTLLLNKKIANLEQEKQILTSQIDLIGASTEDFIDLGEVHIELETKVATTINVELSYYVKNARWYPSYDIRAVSVDEPIQLSYKANIQQNTKEDWNNVKLKVSSANPTLGNVIPELKPYYLDYNIAPPRYTGSSDNNQASGVVYDESGEPLIGASINVLGTTIGAVTDDKGKFSISLPNNHNVLIINCIGYESLQLQASNSMVIKMSSAEVLLDEDVVMGYSEIGGSMNSPKSISRRDVDQTDIALPTQVVENQTVIEFEIGIPYTIKSSNKSIAVEVDRISLPAEYEYYAIPKINKDVFLLANISDWEQYNLLEGEANIFFENTYIGKTVLDTRFVNDTLNISLGRDKSIIVNRESVRENSSKKGLSSNQEQIREWSISVKNNKNQTVNFTLLDQIPVSRRDEIQVKAENISGATLDEQSGKLKWRFVLKPSENKNVKLKYKVKYPKSGKLLVE